MEEAMYVWGREAIQEISVGNPPTSQFCCKPRTAQKKKEKKKVDDPQITILF